MPAAPRTPLDGTERLVIDGTNLLYHMGSGTAAPPAAIIGRLRAAIPAAVSIDLVFDGMAHGVKGRVAQGMQVRYGGRHSADQAILELADEAATSAGGGPAATARVLVVTNDRDLRFRLESRGVRTVPLVWLTNRLDMPKLSAAAAGNRRPTLGGSRPATPPGAVEAPERAGWRPGRGATAKTGPAHKIPRHRRHPRNA
jgi:rRNA-processing protein FCF1